MVTQSVSTSRDLTSLIAALVLHAPLFFLTFDGRRPASLPSVPRLVQIELLNHTPAKPLAPLKPISVATPSSKPDITELTKTLIRNLPPVEPVTTAPTSIKPNLQMASLPSIPVPQKTSLLTPELKPIISSKGNYSEPAIIVGNRIPPANVATLRNAGHANIAIAPNASKLPEIAQPISRRSLPFAISGELSDRAIEQQTIPEYPEGLQAKGITASVVLQFTVDGTGNVKNNIIVRRTSGYRQLDDAAIMALSQWKFAALPQNENRDEVGSITFNFTLTAR